MENSQLELIRFIEGLAANAWRPAVEQHLDGWRLRVSGGSSSRVNSVWPNLMLGSLTLEKRIGIVEDFYRRHEMPACFQICPGALPENLHSELLARGYTDIKHTSVKIAAVDEVINLASSPQVQVVQSDHLTEDWFQAYTTASEYSRESLPIRRGILSRIGPEANFISVEVDGETAATGLGVVERGWMGVFSVVTFARQRRQGLALQLLHALTEWGKSVGADQVYLQVMEDNPPALALYEKLGFRKLYEYWYSQKDLK